MRERYVVINGSINGKELSVSYVVINGSINGKELSVSTKKNPERRLQTETIKECPFQPVKRMVIEDFILKHRILSYFPFMYRFPKRCIVNHDPSSYGQS